MPIGDYNREKTCEVDSINDSGSTVDKAQPIICVDGDDSTTGNGDIVIDFANISDAQDIACYDQNDNLLDYEIEELDTTNNTAVIWVYNSWTRDDTAQLKVAYGDNSANTDRQNVTGTWGNTGQNTEAAYHLDESSGSTIDSTSNNRDSVTTTGTTFNVNGVFDGARGFDGSDDGIEFGSNSEYNYSEVTVVVSINADALSTGTSQTIVGADEGSFEGYKIVADNDSDTLIFSFFGGGATKQVTSSTISTGTNYILAFTVDQANSVGELFLDSTSQGTASGQYDLANGDDNFGIGFSPFQDGRYFDGVIDEVRVHSEKKSNTWIQAEYDASPKAGQVFFSQQAAETTTPTVNQTVSDGLTFNENVASILQFTASDSLTMQENTPSTLIDTLTDNVGFTENLQSTLLQTLTDQLDFTENEAFTLVDTLSDQLTFSDQVLFGAISVTTSDNLTFGENLDSLIKDQLTDQLVLQENLASTIKDSISDQVQFQENFEVAITQLLTDQLSLQENVAATLADTLTDQLTLEDQITATLLTDLDVTLPTKALITNKNKFAVMESHTFKEGDVGDKLKATLEDEDGAIDVSGAKDVKLQIKDRSGTKQLDESMTITDGVNGKVEYKWQSGDHPIENAGVYRAEFDIIDANDEPETVPNDGFNTIEIEEQVN